MATVADTETHVTSAEDASRIAASASTRDRVADAVTCALLPGYCAAMAAERVSDEAAYRTEEARLAAIGAGATLEAEAGSVASGAAGVLRESAEPISELSSAARYASIAATVVVVAIVIAVIAVVVRSYAPLPRLA